MTSLRRRLAAFPAYLRTVGRYAAAVLRWRHLVRLVAFAALMPAGPLSVLGAAGVASATAWVDVASEGHVYTVADAPQAPVALVLGAKVYPDGTPSALVAGRLEVAAELYRAGKIRAVLVSGDNSRYSYDEVSSMHAYLVKLGVPVRKVVRDHAGFDTYDSCVRAKKVFGVTEAIVVSQSYHVPRAVALCRAVGVTAHGVGDDSRRDLDAYRRAAHREYAANVKALLDVVFRPDPTFLGPHEPGVERALA